MNKNLAIVISIITVIVLAGVVIMVPALFQPKTSMTVTFYDADDNVVWSEKTDYGLFEFGFVNEEGTEVSKAVVTVDYVVSGIDSGNNILVHCTFHVDAHLRTIMGGFAGEETWSSPTQLTTTTGSFSREFHLDNFIGVESTGKEWGWRINVDCTLNSRQYTSAAVLVSTAEPWEGTLGFNLDWSEPAAFAIVGSDFNFGPT